ncbi:MAG: MBOAT family O-acyltransferase [Candidatus Spyradocola sp.]|nr:MBOAT family O-acyltransferase [Candidatus Spyradocola sp.]
MVFSSLSFLTLFLPLTLMAYYVSPRRARNAVLFAVSLVFYAWGEPVYVLLMLFSALSDYAHGLLLEKWEGRPGLRRAALISSVCINLGLLGFFKYAGLAVNTLNAALGLSLPVPAVALPIGISFYTFQTMSYTIDVYRRKCPAQHDLLTFGCYVAMFPQLIAGPIVRYVTVADELRSRRESFDGFFAGVCRFLVGLAKKLVLANGAGALWEAVSAQAPAQLSALSAWLGILAFAFQIYFDFSGYSDMAIGLGRMFGFTFPENFRYPYLSRSVSEFWRRWHVTLGDWFREYLYIPLGGNRVSVPRNIFNLAIVWLATGLWHGASWNFLLWGGYFGLLLILEKFVFGRFLQRLPAFFGWLYTALAVLLGWVLFAFEDAGAGLNYLSAMLGGGAGGVDAFALRSLLDGAGLLLLCAVGSTPLCAGALKHLKAAHPRLHTVLTAALLVAGFALCLTYVVDAGYNPFLYFRF